MDWNKKITKGPLPLWLIIIFAVLSGFFFCFLVDPNNAYNLPQHMTTFIFGASGYLCLWLMAKVAKNPTPWLKKNMGLLLGIGGLINAALILWSILGRK